MTATKVARPVPRTLYDHAEDVRALYALVEALSEEDKLTPEAHGEALAQIAQWFAEVGDGFDRKVERCLSMMRELEARADACKSEAVRLELLAQRDERAAERLRDVVQCAMVLIGVEEVRTTRFGDVKIVDDGGLPAVEIVDEDALPMRFFRTPDPVPSREAIRAAIMAGRTVPGARLAPKGRSLRIPKTPRTARGGAR